MKDFYVELKTKLNNCKYSRSYLQDNIENISKKLDWCIKFKKITEEQSNELMKIVEQYLKIY